MEIIKLDANKPDITDKYIEKALNGFDKIRYSTGKLSTAKIRVKIQKIMQKYASVFCIKGLLKEGIEKINQVYKFYKDIGILDRSMIWK